MAGIYIHIPFCKQACHYCDFHFSTNTSRKHDMVEAICHEIILQKNYLQGDIIHTIYLGGGTPSLLAEEELKRILTTVYETFSVGLTPEITLEANPDDLTKEKVAMLSGAGINRLSIGIQSFHEPHLQLLNRAHRADEAINCVKYAQDAGIYDLSIDLIYAIPAEDHQIWQRDLQNAIELQPTHISSYCLTIEEKTVFGNWLKHHKMKEVDDEYAATQFEMLVTELQSNGYEQYEVSNFCVPDHYSRHNSNYWKKERYLGIGPSAHSYDGISRQFNVANNALYLKAIERGNLHFEKEILETNDQINEYVLTGLRTKWGCDLEKIRQSFQYDLYQANASYIQDLTKNNLAHISQNHLILTKKGLLLADRIASDLFIV